MLGEGIISEANTPKKRLRNLPTKISRTRAERVGRGLSTEVKKRGSSGNSSNRERKQEGIAEGGDQPDGMWKGLDLKGHALRSIRRRGGNGGYPFGKMGQTPLLAQRGR